MPHYLLKLALLLPLMWASGQTGALPGRVDTDPAPPVSTTWILEDIGAGLPRKGQWRNSFAVADMNEDGFPDLVHGPARKSRGRPVIFLGDGRGGFTRWSAANFPSLDYDYGTVSVADFDGDGRPVDIAMSCHLRGLTVLIGDGEGNFVERGGGLKPRMEDHEGGIPFSAGALVAVDWNQDGRIDLAAVPEGPARAALRAGRSSFPGEIRLFLNEPDAWRPVSLGPERGSLIGTSLVAGDVNGDDKPDLLMGSSTLGFTKILRINGAQDNETASRLPIAKRAFVRAVALADFDGNGRSDPVVASSVSDGSGWDHRIEVHLSLPDRFETIVVAENELSAVRALAAGDLDGDGAIDLAAVQEDGSLRLYRGQPGGAGFPLAAVEPAPAWRAGCSGYDVHLADLDGDGGLEIVASFAGEPTNFSLAPVTHSGGGIQAWRLCRSQ